MTQSNTERNAHRRARSARRRALLSRLRLFSEIAFESNSIEPLHRALIVILELLNEPMNDEKRKAFMTILRSCSYVAETGYELSIDWSSATDRDLITVEGSLNMRDLASRIAWGVKQPEPLEAEG